MRFLGSSNSVWLHLAGGNQSASVPMRDGAERCLQPAAATRAASRRCVRLRPSPLDIDRYGPSPPCGRLRRIAGLHRLVDRPMLCEQRVARAGHDEDQQPVLEHAVRQQPVAGAQRVQEDDVVRAFADRVVELDVDLRLVLEIAGPCARRPCAPRCRSSRRRSSAVARRAAYSAAMPSISRRYSR